MPDDALDGQEPEGDVYEEESIIPEEDFREAIAVCRRDPELNRYFELAPPGAKLFIGLGFYSTHFGDKVDPLQYAECQAEIEPALAENDLKYLIRFERDKNTKRYLRELLARREAEAAPAGGTAAEAADRPVALPRRKRRKKVPPRDLQTAEARAGIPFPLKAAAVFALLLGGAFLLQIAARSPEAPSAVSRRVEAVAPVLEDAPEPVPARPATRAPRVERTYALVDADEEDADRHGAVVEASGDVESSVLPPEPQADIRREVPAAEMPKRKPRGPHVVFTDGRRIVRRPGGQVEVPRVFSCAGAGIKPFWVYGAHPEAEAAREKAARDEWQALVQQARQFEEAAASAGPDANKL